MRHVRMLGLCLVAVCAIAAVAATSASAGLPELGQCYAKAGGKYANSNCTNKAAKGAGAFEWRKRAQVTESKHFTGAGGARRPAAAATKPACAGTRTQLQCMRRTESKKKKHRCSKRRSNAKRETATGEESGTKEVNERRRQIRRLQAVRVGAVLERASKAKSTSTRSRASWATSTNPQRKSACQLEPAAKKGEFAKFVCAGFITTVVGVDGNTKTEAEPAYAGTRWRDGIISPITPVNQMTHE